MASEIMPTFLSNIWDLFRSITVPGFNFTAADMAIGSFIVVLSIVILKAAINMPSISLRDSSDSVEFHNPFRDYRVAEHSVDNRLGDSND